MKKNHHIVIIGAGQIGSRHLQALANLDHNYHINVIDPSEKSLQMAKERFEEVNTKKINSNYLRSIDDIEQEIDLAIIATTANIRKMIIKELLGNKKVKYLVLEKVVFQSNTDFLEIEKLISLHKTKTWVNCPRRMWNVYESISMEISGEYPISVSITGSHIGIGCNGLHYIDLFAYLIKDANIKLYGDALTNKLYESNRKGFVEFYGNLFGNSDKSTISIISYELDNVPSIVTISTPFKQYILNEDKGIIMTSDKKNNWELSTTEFKMPYQSQLSHIFVEDLINTDSCGLTEYGESMKIHKPILDVLINHYNTIGKNDDDVCPIT